MEGHEDEHFGEFSQPAKARGFKEGFHLVNFSKQIFSFQ